jgi:hypothetical protein
VSNVIIIKLKDKYKRKRFLFLAEGTEEGLKAGDLVFRPEGSHV